MTSFLYGIIFFIMLGFVQYSWFYEPTHGPAIEFSSTRSYIVTSIVLGLLVGYLVTSGITQLYN
ncbi:hypothetical protein [Alkalihalobacillus sp. CinArs1]|uniref:hypothetical protein n=1 Tax=Alkalihalobacillus sp. CinArs1 TaxID=2995314 RepID=UPI0022DE5189|nr:hypothetical protein [Alkalihalobacillus sp. CinArs1]